MAGARAASHGSWRAPGQRPPLAPSFANIDPPRPQPALPAAPSAAAVRPGWAAAGGLARSAPACRTARAFALREIWPATFCFRRARAGGERFIMEGGRCRGAV